MYPPTNLQLYANERKHLALSSEAMSEELKRDIGRRKEALLSACTTPGGVSVARGVQRVLPTAKVSERPRK